MGLLHQVLIFHAGHLDISLNAKAFSIRALAERDRDVDLCVLDCVLLALLASNEVECAREAR